MIGQDHIQQVDNMDWQVYLTQLIIGLVAAVLAEITAVLKVTYDVAIH